ncbi:MAG: Hsp20/alpha crystallin family protein [Rhodospirillales bacterium]|nr:MAG: Hsp20/alpha crystallin family protein [Rhodospirillales bacterium]
MNVRDLIPWSRGRELAPGREGIEHPLVAFQREMDRLFDEFWRGDMPGVARAGGGAVAPRLDVSEDDKAIIVKAELPGLEEKDVEILLSDNMLTIRGEKRAEKEESERGYTYRERSFGAFRRAIPLDAEVIEDKVEAEFKHGVLTVTLPKSPQAQAKTKKIAIKAGDGETKTVD